VAALLPHLVHPDRATADAVLRGLVVAGAPLPPDGRALVDTALAQRCDHADRARTALATTATVPGAELLTAALRELVARARSKAFDLLRLVHRGRLLDRVEAQLADPDPGRRALALETLEVTVGHHWAHQVSRLVAPTESPAEARVEPATAPSSNGDGRTDEAARQWVRELVLDGHEWDEGWVRACALHAAARLLPDADELAVPLRHDPDPVVAETARWVVAQHPQP
jgi:hypothetical protein